LEFDWKGYNHFPTVLFAPYVGQPPDESAKRFSALSKDGKGQKVIDSLKSEFPYLRSLSVEYSSSVPSVFAEVEGQRRKFPVGLISDGVNKLLSILLGIASFPNGTVLIDQIEDGFYFKKLPSIWKVIHEFAKENHTQIFATTHSGECLNALLPQLEMNEGDFALLRAARSDESTQFSVINGRRFGSALSQEFELR
jgi:predicted ATPase